MKKIGFIGAGQIFEAAHYPNFIKFKDNHEITAIFDISSERVKYLSEKYNIKYYFSNVEEMFNSVNLDIVVVCVPNKFHYEHVMIALKHGCHVLCEKPPGINSNEAKEMMEFANKQGKILSYNLHYRKSAEVDFLKKQIEKGSFGNIYNVKVEALRRRGIPGWGNFINKELQGGGPLIDIGIHMMDIALYLLGYPNPLEVMAVSYAEIGTKKNKGVFGSWDPKKFTVEDSVFALIKFENNLSMNLETSFALNMKERSIMNVKLHGSLQGASVFPLEIYNDIDDELVNSTFPMYNERDKQYETICAFLKACNDESANIVTAKEGYILQNIIDGIYKSAETNSVVKF